MENYGVISLIPVAVVIIVAIATRKSFEPLLLGGIIGYIIVEPKNFLVAWINSLTKVAGDLGWYYVLFAVVGCFIMLLEKSGGAIGFADLSAKFAKTRGKSLIITWLLGIALFLDDYLNCLGVSVAMRNITDKFKVPREFLAYVVNSHGASVCILVPISTWGVYMSSQFELVGVTKNGTGLGAFIASIPYMFYAWAAILIVPFFALKILPAFGPMKKAILRAENEGDVFPASYHETHQTDSDEEEITKSSSLNFILPILTLTAVALIKNDVLLGIFAGLIACAVLYLPRKVIKPKAFLECVPGGLQSMAVVIITMTGSFILNAVNTELGLTPYVLDTVSPIISGPLFPLITFVVLGALSFATASPWAMATVAFPIIMPLAQDVGADPFMVGGALIAGTAFGSNVCFYGDAAILTSAACNIQPFDYARTAIPLLIIPTAIAAIGYLILGIVMM